MNLESIDEASAAYESWLGGFMPIVTSDLRLKHQHMAESPFMFLRATFYRWMQHWMSSCKDLSETLPVLAVGDLHIENFGTWRDQDGRLIWGVNDFDETYTMSYTIDLVRLAASAWIANKTGALKIANDDVVESLLIGYERGLRKHGSPFVLEEHHVWLRDIAINELRDPNHFWEKINSLKAATPSEVRLAQKVLLQTLPEKKDIRYFRRTAGLGSLGRPRFVALMDWGGSSVCREAKALAPSAVIWATERSGKRKKSSVSQARKKIEILNLLKVAERVPDPFYRIENGWILRRLAPHCSKIDMSHLPKKRDDLALLQAMGVEIANLHLGSQPAARLLSDLTKKRRREIHAAVEAMCELTMSDWLTWRKKTQVRS